MLVFQLFCSIERKSPPQRFPCTFLAVVVTYLVAISVRIIAFRSSQDEAFSRNNSSSSSRFLAIFVPFGVELLLSSSSSASYPSILGCTMDGLNSRSCRYSLTIYSPEMRLLFYCGLAGWLAGYPWCCTVRGGGLSSLSLAHPCNIFWFTPPLLHTVVHPPLAPSIELFCLLLNDGGAFYLPVLRLLLNNNIISCAEDRQYLHYNLRDENI